LKTHVILNIPNMLNIFKIRLMKIHVILNNPNMPNMLNIFKIRLMQ